MSSPKSDSYEVARNREIEERARVLAVAEAGRVAERLDALRERVHRFQRERATAAPEIPLPAPHARSAAELSTRAAAEARMAEWDHAVRQTVAA